MQENSVQKLEFHNFSIIAFELYVIIGLDPVMFLKETRLIISCVEIPLSSKGMTLWQLVISNHTPLDVCNTKHQFVI